MKKTNRMIAMALAAAVATTAMPTAVFAEDGSVSDSTNTSAPAGTSETKSETTTSTDAAGNTTVTNSTTTTSTDTSSDGVTTESSVTNTDSTTTDTNGNVVATASHQSGETTTTAPGTGENVPAVSVTMSPAPPAPKAEETVISNDGTTSTTTEVVENNGVTTETEVETVTNPDNTVVTTTETTYTENAEGAQIIETEITKVTTEGDVPADANDEEYDYNEETESRKVTVEAQQEKIIVFEQGDGLDENGEPVGETNLKPIQQSETEKVVDDMRIVYDADYYVNRTDMTAEELAAKRAEYDLMYTGFGYDSVWHTEAKIVVIDPETGEEIVKENYDNAHDVLNFALSDVQQKMQNVQATNEDGTPMVDENGDPVYVQAMNEDGTPMVDENGDPVYEQVPMVDEDGNAVLERVGETHIAYCVDLSTYTQDGYWYDIVNLEDSDYYSQGVTAEEAAERQAHIRAIANNGFWGTTEGTGSLADVKAKLQAAYDAAPAKEDGTKDFPMTQDQINNLTVGQAQTATQMAIWKFGNGYDEVDLQARTESAENGFLSKMEEYDTENIVNNLYSYLISLTEEKQETGVITPEKFLSNMTFIVEDRTNEDDIKDETLKGANSDDNSDNDVYNTSVKFALVVQPGEGDDLTVKVVDQNNNVIASKKIAGEGAEAPDADGSYTISGLQLQENSDINFDLKLEGTQYLEQGVYIYQSEVRMVDDKETTSQTFVGMAEGTKSVDVQASVEFQFDVKEGTIKKKHSWKKKSVETSEDDGGGETTPDPEQKEEPTPEPEIVIDEEEVPLSELPGIVLGEEEEPEPMVLGEEEEPVLIAATGDSNHMTGAFGGMFVALAGMFFLRKKKEQ